MDGQHSYPHDDAEQDPYVNIQEQDSYMGQHTIRSGHGMVHTVHNGVMSSRPADQDVPSPPDWMPAGALTQVRHGDFVNLGVKLLHTLP